MVAFSPRKARVPVPPKKPGKPHGSCHQSYARNGYGAETPEPVPEIAPTSHPGGLCRGCSPGSFDSTGRTAAPCRRSGTIHKSRGHCDHNEGRVTTTAAMAAGSNRRDEEREGENATDDLSDSGGKESCNGNLLARRGARTAPAQ